MFFRTDLAIEAHEKTNTLGKISGVDYSEEKIDEIKITRLSVKTDEAFKALDKPKGKYVTIEFPTLTDNFKNTDKKIKLIAKEISALLKQSGLILVAGLGNSNITPDALGPKTSSQVLATRHIQGEIAQSVGLEALKPVAVLTTGVLGQTGIETREFILSVSQKIKPSAIIVIDALASCEPKRLGCTVQISNAGISPGSGVGNARPSISKDTLGIPVISIGVPTVVDAATLAADLLNLPEDNEDQSVQNKVSPRGEPMMVTPREIDLLIDRAAKLIGMSINCALHPDFSPDDLASLVY